MSQIFAMDDLVSEYADAEDPVAEVSAKFDEAVAKFVARLEDFDPFRLTEVVRLAWLPWSHLGVRTGASAGPAHVELVALIATAVAQARGGSGAVVPAQAMSAFASGGDADLDALLNLSHLRAVLTADHGNPLTMIALSLRGAQLFMRNTSYPEKVEETVVALFDGDSEVRQALRTGLGFDAATALAVLDGCHAVQVQTMNDRMHAMGEAVNKARMSVTGEGLDPKVRDATNAKFRDAFEPDVEGSTVSAGEIAAHTGVGESTVAAVIEQFRLDLQGATAAEVVDAFIAGNNALRTHPLLVTDTGRVMLAHDGLNRDAVKENIEAHLKKTNADWARYDKHRGNLLESRTHDALDRLLPGAVHRDGFEYYLPASEKELKSGDPQKYTKRVEGDHLVILDDVAVIVEDKAVALSALSKGGKTARIKNDLTGIITKAAEQSGRLRELIERDGVVRIHGEGLVDLSHIREIHTIAVSLDDLTSTGTATAELVRAGVLDLDNIPWTVSIHDLDLIADLVERPAQFLLYLRRRRNPDATVMFTAPDELDLFLHFFEAGLWVEPDPIQVGAAFPWMPAPTGGDMRRYREQRPVYITSRTDPLDAWFYTKDSSDLGVVKAPKPTSTPSPLAEFAEDIEGRGSYGWLSIGATLLEGSSSAQHKMLRNSKDLLRNPSATGTPRNLTMPIIPTLNPAEGWLLVWWTRPPGHTPAHVKKAAEEHLRVKKYQAGMPRGAAFIYNEQTGDLEDVIYDGHIGELTAQESARLGTLKPVDAFHGRLHPNAKKAPQPAGSSAPRHPGSLAEPMRKSRPRKQPKGKR